MTEEEWIKAGYPDPLERFVQNKASNRKFRLYAVACCRRVWRWISAETSRQAVEVAERLADERATNSERRNAYLAAQRNECPVGAAATFALAISAFEAAVRSADHAAILTGRVKLAQGSGADDAEPELAHEEELATQAHLLRCIVGNPFRPVEFAPTWRSETAVALATGIYAERAFDRLPILADALEEAGCDHADVLSHCRGPGPHTRGCWVVDGVLGKS